jgi:hypothetical protein
MHCNKGCNSMLMHANSSRIGTVVLSCATRFAHPPSFLPFALVKFGSALNFHFETLQNVSKPVCLWAYSGDGRGASAPSVTSLIGPCKYQTTRVISQKTTVW